jgi:hypothetical protein
MTSRDPWPEGVPVPGPVARLRDVAREHGWQALVAYALSGTVRTISVRVARPGWAGYAMYRSPSLSSAWAWSEFKIMRAGSWARPLFLLADFEALLVELPETAEVFERYATTCRQIHENGLALAKERERERVAIRALYARCAGVAWPAGLLLAAGAVWEHYGPDDVVKILERPMRGREVG